jgi:hypothetical protein
MLARRDVVDRPALGWWVAILGGLGLLGVLGMHAGAYAVWARYVTGLFSQTQLFRIFVLSYVIHLGEALWARRLARRSGLHASANGWAFQTFLIGFPSLRLLRARGAQIP